ncbi:hypothetical protein [Chthoniobacter flavus]|nr:hypothetical protein [Chthoniobacter flavus]
MNHKIILPRCHLAGLMTLCLASVSALRAEAPATPAPPKLSGPPKVQVLVRENSVATAVGGSSAATPAPGGAKGGGKGQTPNPAQAAATALDAEKFTRTTKKTLTVTLVDVTGANMDVNVKTTFLGRDEAGKHEVVEEKTVENKVTLQPRKAQDFTTEEVSFTHTTAHHAAIKKGSGGAGAGGRNAVSSMIPASGHAYYGYRVEVFQGQDLVGMASSEMH